MKENMLNGIAKSLLPSFWDHLTEHERRVWVAGRDIGADIGALIDN